MPQFDVEAITIDEARLAVQSAEDAFNRADLDRILSVFTDDVTIRFAEQPEMRGIEQAKRFLQARLARQVGYRLHKTLRAVSGNIIGVEWTGDWKDRVTGRQMQGRGCEFWVMRGGKIAVWDAAFNVWEADGPRLSPIL